MLEKRPASQGLLLMLGQGTGGRRCYGFLGTPLWPGGGEVFALLFSLISWDPLSAARANGGRNSSERLRTLSKAIQPENGGPDSSWSV